MSEQTVALLYLHGISLRFMRQIRGEKWIIQTELDFIVLDRH